jgi:hypothetical protein
MKAGNQRPWKHGIKPYKGNKPPNYLVSLERGLPAKPCLGDVAFFAASSIVSHTRSTDAFLAKVAFSVPKV